MIRKFSKIAKCWTTQRTSNEGGPQSERNQVTPARSISLLRSLEENLRMVSAEEKERSFENKPSGTCNRAQNKTIQSWLKASKKSGNTKVTSSYVQSFIDICPKVTERDPILITDPLPNSVSFQSFIGLLRTCHS